MRSYVSASRCKPPGLCPRAILSCGDGTVRPISRNGHSFTALFGPISDLVARLPRANSPRRRSDRDRRQGASGFPSASGAPTATERKTSRPPLLHGLRLSQRERSLVGGSPAGRDTVPEKDAIRSWPRSVSAAAWKTIPSWYIVSSQDQAINPELERFYAKRMRAKTTEINSSHVSFISHPREVTKVIEEASRATQ
jgi:pimeloyl-ACP methyl ester carboxylesterase